MISAKKTLPRALSEEVWWWARKESDLRCFLCHGFTVRCVRRCATDPYGGTGWSRTNDTLGFNQVLYQLSYGPVWRSTLVPTQTSTQTRPA